jgi:hypothetical protein
MFLEASIVHFKEDHPASLEEDPLLGNGLMLFKEEDAS